MDVALDILTHGPWQWLALLAPWGKGMETPPVYSWNNRKVAPHNHGYLLLWSLCPGCTSWLQLLRDG